jgi:hypothetical protein
MRLPLVPVGIDLDVLVSASAQPADVSDVAFHRFCDQDEIVRTRRVAAFRAATRLSKTGHIRPLSGAWSDAWRLAARRSLSPGDCCFSDLFVVRRAGVRALKRVLRLNADHHVQYSAEFGIEGATEVQCRFRSRSRCEIEWIRSHTHSLHWALDPRTVRVRRLKRWNQAPWLIARRGWELTGVDRGTAVPDLAVYRHWTERTALWIAKRDGESHRCRLDSA